MRTLQLVEPLPAGARMPPRPPAPPTTGDRPGTGGFARREPPAWEPIYRPSIRGLVREVIVELRRVAWPAGEQTLRIAAMVVGLLVVLMLGLLLMNVAAAGVNHWIVNA